MKSFFELASERYSVRGYSSQPIEPEKLDLILEAGRIAPTACNNQPQRIKVITAGEELAKIDECTPCRFGAPAILLVCYDKTVCWKREFDGALSGEVDASIITTHMMLAAHDLGLGSCWVMYFNPAKTIELFALPDTIAPVAMLPVGYPAKDAAASEGHYDRLPLEKTLF